MLSSSRIIQVLADLVAASRETPCHPARDAAIYLLAEFENGREALHRRLIERGGARAKFASFEVSKCTETRPDQAEGGAA